MTFLLTLLIVLFVAVAIRQLVKIYDLAQTNTSSTQVADDSDNKLNGNLMLGFLAFIYIFTIVCIVKWGDLPLLSHAASEHGPQIDNLMIISLVRPVTYSSPSAR